MKPAAALLLFVCLMAGCQAENDPLDQAIDLRKRVLEAQGCTFLASVTADYEDAIYTFQLDCKVDSTGKLQFTVTEPETINGVTGSISESKAALTFDDKILAFPMLADGELSPVSAPWIFINTLRSGYLSACGSVETGYCIYIDDSFEEDPLHLQIYTGPDMVPLQADIIYHDLRILTVTIKNFTLQ